MRALVYLAPVALALAVAGLVLSLIGDTLSAGLSVILGGI